VALAGVGNLVLLTLPAVLVAVEIPKTQVTRRLAAVAAGLVS
jgi:hypothetical protein